MERWRYKVIRLEFAREPQNQSPAAQIEAALNRAGDDGWELVKSDILLSIASHTTTSADSAKTGSSLGRSLADVGAYIGILKKPRKP